MSLDLVMRLLGVDKTAIGDAICGISLVHDSDSLRKSVELEIALHLVVLNASIHDNVGDLVAPFHNPCCSVLQGLCDSHSTAAVSVVVREEVEDEVLEDTVAFWNEFDLAVLFPPAGCSWDLRELCQSRLRWFAGHGCS